MNIFLTGIAGFLGRHITKKLIDNGHKVQENDNLIGGDRENVPKGCHFHNVDCKEDLLKLRMQLAQVIKQEKFWIIKLLLT